MKKFFTLFLMCASLVIVSAQGVANYSFSTNTGDTLFPTTGGAVLVVSAVDDNPGVSIPIGFSFNYAGLSYSNISASPDGFAVLGTAPFTAASDFSNVIAGPVAANTTMLFPWWDDLATGSAAGGGQITSTLVGTAPNRIRVINWFVTIPRLTTGPANANFQLWLYETSNVIQFRYGSAVGTSFDASVGILNNIGGLTFQSVTTSTHTVSNVTANNSNAAFNVNVANSGRSYTFTPPACPAPTGPLSNVLSPDSAVLSWTTGGSTQWLLEFGIAGFTPGSGTLITGAAIDTMSGLLADTDYEWYVRDYCAPGDSSAWVGPNSFTTLSACPVPSALATTFVGGDSVELSWTTGGATEWILEYGLAGYTPGSGTQIATTSNPGSITGLASASTYDIYVRDYCGPGDSSLWGGPLSVSTPILPLTCTVGGGSILYTEDFETDVTVGPGGSSGTVGPWTQVRTTDPDWTWDGAGGTPSSPTGPSGAFNGSGFVYLETSGTAQNADTLTSGTYDLSSVSSPARLRFYYHMFGADIGTMTVETSDDGGATWNPGIAFVGQQQNSDTEAWKEAAIDISYAVGSSNFRMRFIGDKNNSPTGVNFFFGDMAIDFIRIEACVSCPAPTALAVDAVGSDTAQISWTSGGATEWIVQYGPAGFVPGTGTIVSTTSNPFTIIGLMELTAYDVYVRDYCAPGDSSLWIGPASFRTELTPLSCPSGTGAPFVVFETSFEGNPGCVGTGSTVDWNGFLGWSNTNNLGGTFNGANWRIDCGFATPNGWVDAGPLDGSAYAHLETSNAGIGGDPLSDTLTTNAFDISTLQGSARVTANYLNGGSTTLLVERSTDGGATWTNIFTDNGLGGNANPDLGEWTLIADDITAFLGVVTSVTYRFIGIATNNSGDIGLDLLQLETCVSCVPPSAVSATVISSDSAQIDFTAFAAAQSVIVEYGLAGFTPGSGIIDTTSADSLILSGLMSNSDYEYYIGSDCSASSGDSSVLDGPFTFSTPCATFVPFYNTNFNTLVPACWELANDGNPTTGPTGFGASDNWVSRSTYNSAGSAVVNLFTTGSSDWLLSPTFDLSAGAHEVVIEVAITNFNSAAADVDGMTGTDDEVQLLYSDDNGLTWNNITTWNSANQPGVNGSIETFTVPSTASSVQFGIWASEGAVDNLPDYDFHVNDFTVQIITNNDVGVSAILSPSQGCGEEFSVISVSVENFGLLDQTNIPVEVVVSGAFTGTYTVTLANLLAGASDTLLIDSFNTLVGGTANILAYTSLVGDESFVNDTSSTTVEFSAVPVAPVFASGTICEGDSFSLSSSQNVKVYEAGSSVVLANDTAFTLSPSVTTMYEYEAIGSITENVGETTPPTTGFTTTPDWGLRFIANSDFVLNSVVLYPSGTGTITISIMDDATETVLQSIPGIAISDGGTPFSPVTVPLGFVIPESTSSYRIVMTAFTGITTLGRDFASNFPYTTSGGEVNIINGSTGTPASTSTAYYWFYDWNVSIEGCPSDREMFTVMVTPTTFDTLAPVTACDTFDFNGVNITSSGVYSDTLSSTTGCDSVIVQSVTINNSTVGTSNVSICAGQSTTLPDGVVADTAGVYTSTILNALGCDSVITTTVTILDNTDSTQNVVLCFGESTMVGASVYSADGTYTDTLTNAVGCDSVVTTNLTILAPITSADSYLLCSGGSISIGSNTYNNAGVYTDVLTSSAGCDSTVTSTVAFIAPITLVQNVQLCTGDSVVVGANAYDTTGSYTDVFVSASGCDSTVTTNLVVFTSVDVTLGGVSTVCDNADVIDLTLSPAGGVLSGPGVTGDSFDPAAAGVGSQVLTYTFTDNNGCDATASLNVEVVVCTGIEDIEGIETISVYPNPFVSSINVVFDDATSSELTIKLLDVTGRVLTTKVVNTTIGANSILLEVPADVAAGVTIMQIERDGAVYSTTLIKQ